MNLPPGDRGWMGDGWITPSIAINNSGREGMGWDGNGDIGGMGGGEGR